MRVDRVVTTGVFQLAGVPTELENNVWVLGNDEEVIVVDASHDAAPIVEVVGGRKVKLIFSTHGHRDHIDQALTLAEAVEAPVGLHPADLMLWDLVHPDVPPDLDLVEGMEFELGDARLTVLHTPGHTPGSVCLRAEGEIFVGDTLFPGGPGATHFRYGDFPTIVESITQKLFVLPHDTVVHPGHGDDTTIGAELPGKDSWQPSS